MPQVARCDDRFTQILTSLSAQTHPGFEARGSAKPPVRVSIHPRTGVACNPRVLTGNVVRLCFHFNSKGFIKAQSRWGHCHAHPYVDWNVDWNRSGNWSYLLTHELGTNPRKKPPKDYVFSVNKPPLLKDYYGEILLVPSDKLRQVVGTATWDKTQNFGAMFEGRADPIYQVNTYEFKLTRVRHWELVEAPTHLAVNSEVKLTWVKGYSKTQRVSFARQLETEVGGTLKFGDSSVDSKVKETLNMSKETTDYWHEEQTKELTRQFPAKSTYATWKLVDTLILDKETNVSGHCCASTTYKTQDLLDNVVFLFEDSVGDSETRKIFNGSQLKTIYPQGREGTE